MKAITKERANQLIYECTRFCETPKDRLELATKIEQSLCIVHTRNENGEWDVGEELPKDRIILVFTKDGNCLTMDWDEPYNGWTVAGEGDIWNLDEILAWCEVPTLSEAEVG